MVDSSLFALPSSQTSRGTGATAILKLAVAFQTWRVRGRRLFRPPTDHPSTYTYFLTLCLSPIVVDVLIRTPSLSLSLLPKALPMFYCIGVIPL